MFELHGFEELASRREHVALTFGAVSDAEPVLGRLHSECLTGDGLYSLRCDCGAQLESALAAIADALRRTEGQHPVHLAPLEHLARAAHPISASHAPAPA